MNYASHKQSWIKLTISVLLTLVLVACVSARNDQQMVQAAKDYLVQNKMREAALELKNALQINPDNAEARFMLGQINLDIGDSASAEKEFRRARKAGWQEDEVLVGLARAMNNSKAYQKTLNEVNVKESYPSLSSANLYGLRAVAYAGLGQLDQAKETLSRGMEINSDAFHILKTGIQLELAAGSMDTANALLSKAQAKYPDSQGLLLLSAVMAVQNHNTDKAVAVYNTVIEMDPTGLVTVYGRKARLELARLEILSNKLDQAESILVPLFRQNTNDPLTNYMGGMLAYQQNNFDLAEERLQKVLKVVPGHVPTQLLYGAVSYAQQDYEQAAYYLARYVSEVGDNLGARKLLGRTYMMLGQHNEARDTLQPGLSGGADDAELLALVGMSEIQGGNTLTGIEDLEKAVRASPESTSLRGELAKAYIFVGQTDNAVQILNSILAEGGDKQQTEALIVYTHLRAGQFTRAIDAVLEMLERDSDNPAVLSLAGSVFAAASDTAEARKYFAKALQMRSGFIPATLALARLEELEGNKTKAEELYRSISGKENNTIEPLIALARMAEARGDMKAMLGWLEKAREQFPENIKPRVFLAEYYLRQKQPDKANRYVEEATKIAPRDNTLLAMQGKVSMAQRQYNEALITLQKLIAEVPDSAYARVLLGETYLKLGQIQDARNQLEIALEKQPYSVPALALIATGELQSGNYEETLAYAKQMQKIEPELYMGYEIAGDALIKKHNNAEAIAAFQAAWERSQSSELAIKLSEVSMRLGQHEDAVKPLLAWLSDHPEDARVLQFLGTAYQNMGEYNSAIEVYEKALAKQPQDVVVLNNLAWLYSKTGNSRALDLAERAYKGSPGDAGVLDTYGWILVQNGQVARGRRILDQAIEKLPDVPEVRYHHAVALFESGEKIAARKQLEKLLAEGKAFEGRDHAVQLIK